MIRCSKCGRFTQRGICYTPFGNCLDFEPPDEEYICHRCWDSMSLSEADLTYRIAWIKPYEFDFNT